MNAVRFVRGVVGIIIYLLTDSRLMSATPLHADCLAFRRYPQSN